MLLGWYVSSSYIETSEKINTNKTLTSVGRLKANQIQAYLAERKGDAAVVSSFLSTPSAQHWLKQQDGNAPDALNRLAESVVTAYQYRGLLLLDAEANVRLNTGHSGMLAEAGKAIALRAMREHTPISFQIYFGDPSAPDVPVLDTFVPVMDADGTASVGVVVLRSGLNFLFDLIQTWPSESETAELLLVTKDGSDVLFLNNLRHQKDTALKLRVPLSNDPNAPAWPAISVLTGHLGLFEANDYRGKHVLAYTIAVPGTPWGIVVKVDVEEATKRSHTLQKFTAMTIAIILGLAGIIVWIWWRKAETLHELQVMLDTSGEGFWRVDQSGGIIEVNDAYCRLAGYARDEIVGAHVSKFEAIEQTPEAVAEHVRHVVEQGYDRFETKHRHHDGHLIDMEVVASFIPETKCVIVFLHDVTERKLAEALTQQFGRLLHESFNEIYLFDASTLYFTQVSEGAKRNLGYSTDELKQLTPLDIKPSFTRESFEQMIAPLRNGERESLHFETFHRRKDGTTYPVEASLQLMTTTTFLVVIQDITERKLADDMLRVAATTFETHEGIVITDVHANIIRVNRAFQDITGYSQKEVLGKNPRARSSGLHDKAFYAAMWQQLLNNGSWTGEIWNKRKNGQIYPEWLTITAVKNEQGETTEYVAIFSDITARKEAEERLRDSNDELEAINRQLSDTQNLLLQSDKMASVGQLAAGVAHEINNPIGYVSSNLGTLDEYLKELLDLVAVYEEAENVVADSAVLALVKAEKDKVDLGFLREDIPALMRETQEGIIRVKKIVQDLKDFSRADSGDEWHRTDLHKGLDSTLNVASNEIKYKADVKKEYGDIPEVECVISQLNQVFMNLLVNAAHAIENYGIITLRTGQQGGEVWVEVADTGKGIAPEHINKIFDPFFTTKPIGKGTGLGLSLSYGIIQKHHGRIEVNSEVGKGTSFKVWLPVSQPQDDDTAVGRVSSA